MILSVWVIVSQSSDASQATESGLVLSDDGTVLEDYTGNGGAVTIPDGVTTINAGVFASKDITSVVMPSSVTSMGTGVFSGCTSLASVSLSSSLNGIPEETFRECLSLGSVTIPDSATSIGSNAFTDVHRLVLSAFRQVSAVFLRMLSADAAIFPISQWHPAMVLMHLRMDVYTMRQRPAFC